MVYKYKYPVIIFLLVLLVGCGHTSRIEIKPRAVVPPVIEEIIQADTVTDSVISASEVSGNDTIAQIKYYPKTKTFKYKVKPAPILIMDTTETVIIKEIKEEPKKDKSLTWFILGMVLVVLIYIFYRIYFRR